MNVLRVRILPVYSEEHANTIPGSMTLLKHQVATLEAFQNPNIDVIFNTSMTGDGKSLAAYLPVFQQQQRVVAMYPTNELVQDQYKALPRYHELLGIQMPQVAKMYREEVTRLMNAHDTRSRFDEVKRLITRHRVLLTNPDLIHLIMSLQYGWDYQRKELPFELGAHFDYFLFDEFHVFGVPQIISVMNMLGYWTTYYKDNPNYRKKFVFLSATPNPLFRRLLDRANIRYLSIEGSYRSTEHPGYRCILQPCELELQEVSPGASIEQWVEEHLEEILNFFKQHKGSKAAILVSSVAVARRLVALLKNYFEPHGISVGENTGITRREEKVDSLMKDILVGTSTVDVGIDFRINLLIFEAFSAGTFLQRIGRLGRHPGYPFYKAYGLVPRYILERLEQRFEPGAELERCDFNAEINEVFPREAQFQGYSRRWGVLQAAQVLSELQTQLDENTGFRAALIETYEQFYGNGEPGQPVMKKAQKRYYAKTKKEPQIVAELRSFRGRSPLSCGMWDLDGHLQTYDLFFLLANTEFEVLDEQVFMQEVQRQKGSQQLDESDFRGQLLYLKIIKYIPERQRLLLSLPYNVGDHPEGLHHAQILNHFSVEEPRTDQQSAINKALHRQKLVCVLSDMHPQELKRRLGLGPLFQLCLLQDLTGAQYAVAFGQDALLLDSILFWRKTKGDQAMLL